MRTWWLSLVGAAFALSTACATGDNEFEEELKAEWNARMDASKDRNDHPCGDFVFDAWADRLYAGCEPGLSATCDHKHKWLWARARQCDEWQQYLLRNHFKHVRRDDIPEPDMHID